VTRRNRCLAGRPLVAIAQSANTKNPIASYAADRLAATGWASVDWTLARAVRTGRFWWLTLSYFCALFTWYLVQVHQTKHLIEVGFDPKNAAWALGLVSLVAVPGQIALGHLSDRIRREWVWTIGNGGFVLSCAALLALPTLPAAPLLWLMVVEIPGHARFVADSPLEGAGFEPSVPRPARSLSRKDGRALAGTIG
jgi:hypothetical protein